MTPTGTKYNMETKKKNCVSNYSGSSKDSSKMSGDKKTKTKEPKVNHSHFSYDYEAKLLQSEEYQFAFFADDDCADMMLLNEFHSETNEVVKSSKKKDDDNGWVFIVDVGSKKKK